VLSEEISRSEEALVVRQSRAEQMLELVKREQPLMLKVQDVESEQRRLQAQLEALRPLQGTNVHEFAVLTPATVAPEPVSNHKKILASPFIASLVFFLGLMVAHERFVGSCSAEEWAGKVGLPVLAKSAATRAIAGAAARGQTASRLESRRLALRIRQHLASA